MSSLVLFSFNSPDKVFNEREDVCVDIDAADLARKEHLLLITAHDISAL